MTNEEMYETAEERAEMFGKFCCKRNNCSKCPANSDDVKDCRFVWLSLEADPVIEPCPFCSSAISHGYDEMHEASWCQCSNPECRYMSGIKPTAAEALAAHNRVARAVAKAKAKEGDEK